MAQTATSTHPQPPAVAVSPVLARLARSKLAFALRAPIMGGGGESSTAGASGSKGMSRKRYTDDNDDEWYIPYNGPITEPPQGKGSEDGKGVGPVGKRLVSGSESKDTRVRDSWGDFLDEGRTVGGTGSGRVGGVGHAGVTGFGVGVSVGIGAGLGGATLSGSAHGHGSAGGHSRLSVATSSAEDHHQPHAHFTSQAQQQASERERNKLSRGRSLTRDRAVSAASRYTDSAGVASPGVSPRSAHAMGHGTGAGHGRLPVPSFLNLDQTATGIGECPVPAQRGGGGHAHAHGHGLGYGMGVGHSSGGVAATENGSVPSFGQDLAEFGQTSPPKDGQAGQTIGASHARSPSQQTIMGTNATHMSAISSAPSASMYGAGPGPPSSFPTQQNQHQRGSFASFWTFGGNKRSPTHGTHQTRPSVETFWSRPSTSTHGTGLVNSPLSPSGGIGGVVPISRTGTRERAATIDDRYNLLGQPAANVHAPAMSTRPRANTSGGRSIGASPQMASRQGQQGLSSSQQQTTIEQHAQQQPQHRPQQPPPPLYRAPASPLMGDVPTSGSDESHSPYQRVPHPYAVAFPNKGHREHSTLLQPRKTSADENQPPIYGELRVPVLNLPSRFSNSSSTNGIPAHLKSQPNRLIKASLSTPNLRAASVRQGSYGRPIGGSQPTTPGFGAKWLSAETWCDALIFPRPRFKVRTAHLISPPESPSNDQFVIDGPHSAPLKDDEKMDMVLRQHQPRVLKKSHPKEKEAHDAMGWLTTPTSAPPQFSSPPVYKPSGTLRPPRPKSFAQDDLALPSPTPSLAT